ncbi:ATP-binding protein [Streptomyces solicathayae]|uniref:ATP-binding protein n=1 Tax=Streptomyces solicathayae TaxID=3081768 RepID=A0ABZ0LP13_9ACTN|nr:ATP-binding protein [Streptomyces sp. HUAS YS2]WOX21228.1 ATP-binding protein [Streptomyces sp. HUAS YS2]
MQFTSTPRGARLARRLASHRLDDWGHPYTSTTNETLTLITAELAANAVRHGHVPGRDFRLRLLRTSTALRVEVTDTRTERRPTTAPTHTPPSPGDESGRGLFLVSQLADRFGCEPRTGGAPGKTVWAELDVPSSPRRPTSPTTHPDPISRISKMI